MKLNLIAVALICIGYSAQSQSGGDQPVCYVSKAALLPGTYNIGIVTGQKSAWDSSLKAAALELKKAIPSKYEGVVFEYSFIKPEENIELSNINYTTVILASDKAHAIPSAVLTNKDIMFVESGLSKEAAKNGKNGNNELLINASKHLLLGVSAVAGKERNPMITRFTTEHLKQTMSLEVIEAMIEKHVEY